MTRDDTATDDETSTDFGRRRYLQATTAAVVGAVGLAGCSGGGGDGGGSDGGDGDETGVLATQVTDDPGDIEDFESCVVTIVGYWLGPTPDDEGDDEDEETEETEETAETTTEGDGTATVGDGTPPEDVDGEREYVELDEPVEADLVELQDGATQLLGEDERPTGSHAFLQLDVDGVDATLKEGGEPTVEFPGNAPVTFNEAFEISADTRTTFTADFTPVQRGRTNRYLIQPVPSGITVTYEAIAGGGDDGGDGGDEDGTATPEATTTGA